MKLEAFATLDPLPGQLIGKVKNFPTAAVHSDAHRHMLLFSLMIGVRAAA